jgi:hypothetical protein
MVFYFVLQMMMEQVKHFMSEQLIVHLYLPLGLPPAYEELQLCPLVHLQQNLAHQPLMGVLAIL